MKLLIIEAFKDSLYKVIDRLHAQHPELGSIEVYLLTSQPEKYKEKQNITVIETDYSDDSLHQAFSLLGNDVRSVICRGDRYVQFLRKVVEYLPSDAYVSSEDSLEKSTNKRLMRQAFLGSNPEITPSFIRVSPESIITGDELTFPVIIKPASLASSILIQRCDSLNELHTALPRIFEVLSDTYIKEGRNETPEIIVEEFLNGEFYSIDSYVLGNNEIYHLPAVHYIPAKSLGIDDFSLYKRSSPVDLPDEEEAQSVATKAIKALGLTYTAAHIELVKTESGWKVIEVGPRLGRFRNIMYRESYGIDHGYNDLLIHCGLPPEVESIPQARYCAAYSIYPSIEGKLVGISHISDIESSVEGINYLKAMANPGEIVFYAKNGGHALLEIIFSNTNKQRFDEDVRWFEQNVKAEVSVQK